VGVWNHLPLPLVLTKPLGMQASIIPCLSQARINWEGCSKKSIWCKNGEMMEVGALIVQMVWRPDGLSVHLPLLSLSAALNQQDGEQ